MKIIKENNIIYVDFVLDSMIESIKKWYREEHQHDYDHVLENTHIVYLFHFYNKDRFKDYRTIGEERIKYLEEIDLYVQMRRDD